MSQNVEVWTWQTCAGSLILDHLDPIECAGIAGLRRVTAISPTLRNSKRCSNPKRFLDHDVLIMI
eukprot:4956091-Pyramimonas_sp.AAC.1